MYFLRRKKTIDDVVRDANKLCNSLALVQTDKHDSDEIILHIPGYLTSGDDELRELHANWLNTLRQVKPNIPIYTLKWPSEHPDSISSIATSSIFAGIVSSLFMPAPFIAAPILTSAILSGNIKENWHTASYNATLTGIVLPIALSQQYIFKNKRITIIGHSLGARVAYCSLCTLLFEPVVTFENVYLYGGAVNISERWHEISHCAKGKIFNGYNRKDPILQKYYKSAENYEEPIGLGPINSNNIVNIDYTKYINADHTYYPYLNKSPEFCKTLTTPELYLRDQS